MPDGHCLNILFSGGGPRQPWSSGLAPVSRFHSSVPLSHSSPSLIGLLASVDVKEQKTNVTTRMIPALRVGSDENHFNVSVGSDGQSHKTVSIDLNLFEEKGEPKRHRTEVLPLTSQTPYR